MKNLLKQTMYMGLGLASMTKEKLEGFAKDVSKYTDMSEEEGRKFADSLGKESEKARERLRSDVECMVAEAFKKMPCGKKLGNIDERLAAIEARLDALAGSRKPAASQKASKA